jgi:hypothetical protein
MSICGSATSASSTGRLGLRGWSLLLGGVLVAVLMFVLPGQAKATHALTYQIGDVFVAVPSSVQWRESNGTLHSTPATLPSGFNTGMAFDTSANLYVTNFGSNNVSKLNNAGVLLGPFGAGYNAAPESIVFDAAGNAYVGQASGTEDILKFSSAGAPLASYNVATENVGSDWIDLASDQCTMYYTSEGKTIFRYNVCTSTQLTPFATGLPGSNAFALRIRSDGGVLVADRQNILRLNASGGVVQTYDATGQDNWFALNLDPDGTSFWSADFNTGNVYKFSIATGAVLLSFNAGPPNTVFGLAVFGELTAAKNFTLTLEPQTDENPVGSPHTVTATLKESGNPEVGAKILFSVTGANTAAGAGVTDANGQATFTYTGTNLGTDTITACYDANSNAVCDSGELTATATKRWVVGPPAKLTLSPKTATNPVDSQHCVTATVQDAANNPVPNIIVRFSVTGSVTTSGQATTNASGQATFCYTGPALPGADAIHAYADTNNNGTQDPGEPSDDATKTWILPVTTPGCEIKITNGGWIIANNTDQASFGGNAKADADGNVTGNEEYQDRGPVQPFNLHGNVLVIVCGTDGKSATIFGEATIDGSGSNIYRIDVTDNAEPGKGADTYRMRVNTYDSGNQVLRGGNIQVHKS